MKRGKRTKKTFRPLTSEQVEEHVRKRNFWQAFEMLCEKAGKRKEFFWYVRNRDADATRDQKAGFIKMMTRLLSFNYDVHRRPNPIGIGTLKQAGQPGSMPLNYPPEWKEEQ